MARQKIKAKSKNTCTHQANNSRAQLWPFFVAVLVIAGVLITVVVMNHRRLSKETSDQAKTEKGQSIHATPTPQMTEQALKDSAWDPAWPPLPDAGTPAKPLDQVRVIYAFAARHPEVLQYAPCYCGCESGGHQSVRDCFVKGHDAGGKPQWDGMGFI